MVYAAPQPQVDATAGFTPGRGLLVVGHGTADAVGAAETRAVAEALAALLPGVPVELGFLEVIGPSIHDALHKLADRGCPQVVAAPLLLFAAGHAKRDVPEAIVAAAAATGQRVVQAEPLGCHADVVSASRERRRQALAGLPALDPGETVLVMVGRGSSDPAALGLLGAFAEASLAGDAVRPRRL
jgi:sirohydrochlorin cobaltochelatase